MRILVVSIQEKYRGLSYEDLLYEVKKRGAGTIPQHIAIIMDGNGRWAQKRGLPRYEGHRHGVERIRDMLTTCGDIGVEYLTLYTFSTENWRRPQPEVSFLMKLINMTIKKEYEELHRNNIRVKFLGELEGLPLEVRDEIERVVHSTRENSSLTLSLAINYGGRAEILKAAKELCRDQMEKGFPLSSVDERFFSSYFYTTGMPDPELLIRTGGEWRVSNFLLWQLAYAEFLVSKIYWPDFTREELCLSILDYQNRERRFGGIQ